MITCAYCGKQFSAFTNFKRHLKVYHNKRTVGDKLLCGQGGCPLDYMSVRRLQKHIERYHEVISVSTLAVSDDGCDTAHTGATSAVENDEPSIVGDDFESQELPRSSLIDEVHCNGALNDAANFVCKLRSNPKIPLSVSLDVVESCKDLFTTLMSPLRSQVDNVLRERNVDSEKSRELIQTMSVLENPFIGLETLYQQTRYFAGRGLYIAPQSFAIGQQLCPVTGPDGISYRTKLVTGEYVKQTDVIKTIFSISGVLHEVISYLESDRQDGLICDFKDGILWKNHPVRLKYLGVPNTVVVPVFDFFDDVETANPLGSHATIHKIGCKYTVIKGFKPCHNSKLENILLNMVFRSADRNATSNKDLLAVYLTEMTDLETKGIQINVDGSDVHVYICLVQVTGDNLGLNSILGFVESFTASYPCRLCKVRRDEFTQHFTETDELRTRESYDSDIVKADYTVTGIKERCCYNKVPSFHVSQNVFCDIMHDLLEGVCRYVMLKVVKCLVISKSFFSLNKLNHRISTFSFDHSSPPPFITHTQLKGDTLVMGAMEMLNFVLGFALMVGDLVPQGDDCWEVYELMRTVLVFCCGLCFSSEDLSYMRILIAEFLTEYSTFFRCSVSLKFHNLTHYPRVIATLGPLYHMWVMRCEAKNSETKKVAHSSGNFKNICRTIAVRHQMKQAARLMTQKGINNVEVTVDKCESLVLFQLVNGQHISSLIGNYGLYREMFATEKIHVNSICYTAGQVLIQQCDDLFPVFARIDRILFTDSRDCFFVCCELTIVEENSHYQAFHTQETENLTVIAVDQLDSLPSPWPLKCRTVSGVTYVSLKHKIWCELFSFV